MEGTGAVQREGDLCQWRDNQAEGEEDQVISIIYFVAQGLAVIFCTNGGNLDKQLLVWKVVDHSAVHGYGSKKNDKTISCLSN